MGFPSLYRKMPDFPILVEDTKHSDQLKLIADETKNSTHAICSDENNNSVGDAPKENNKQEIIQKNSKFIYSLF